MSWGRRNSPGVHTCSHSFPKANLAEGEYTRGLRVFRRTLNSVAKEVRFFSPMSPFLYLTDYSVRWSSAVIYCGYEYTVRRLPRCHPTHQHFPPNLNSFSLALGALLQNVLMNGKQTQNYFLPFSHFFLQRQHPVLFFTLVLFQVSLCVHREVIQYRGRLIFFTAGHQGVSSLTNPTPAVGWSHAFSPTSGVTNKPTRHKVMQI